MKNKSLVLFGASALVTGLLFIQGCKDTLMETKTFTANVPVYKSYDDMRTEVATKEVQPLKNPGKIFVKGDYILVNEFHKGIHVINNQDPHSPQKISFINVPGNVDINVKGSVLYADSYVDLVAIDISDIMNISEIGRVKNVFQYSVPKFDASYPLANIDEAKGVIESWEIKEVTETCVNEGCGQFAFNDNGMLVAMNQNGGFGAAQGGNAKNATVEISGSMSRFSIRDNCLYTVSTVDDITVFAIGNPGSPSPVSTVKVSSTSTIETSFTNNNYLFIGAQDAMFIYDIASCSPQYVSQFEHAEACDPVIVYDQNAYVSLNSRGPCGGWQNQVDIVDISTISNPQLKTTLNMTGPKGMSIDPNNNMLFVCDGSSGMQLYDISQVNNTGSWGSVNVPYVSQVSGVDAFDVIYLMDRLMLIGDDGLYQYSYDGAGGISQISVIPVEG